MSNVLERQILQEGWRNVTVKLTGVLDSSDVTVVPAVALTEMLNNDPNLILKGFRVDEIEYAIGPGLSMVLEWNGNAPQQIAPLTGWGEVCWKSSGGACPDMLRSGYDGSINLRTSNFAAPGNLPVQNYTITLWLVKLYWRTPTAL